MKENKLPYNHNKPFRVPENYFGSLEDRLMEKVASVQAQDEDMKALDAGVDNGFKVPENYFDSFEDKLMSKLENKPKQPKVISLLNSEMFYYIAGTAAVFIALITTLFTNPSQPVGFEDLDVVTIEGYLHETLDFSKTDMSQYLNEGEFSFAPSGQSDADQEAVIEYLHETMEEPSMILNED